MSSDADAHKVGLIPVTLMVSGNIMGSGVFLLPANLAATGGLQSTDGWSLSSAPWRCRWFMPKCRP
ncbi:Arginine/agmatine antiporter [Salmonella enterica subsp. enterica serovar Newport]|nr:Arginine/agmatine antiporter [Salmonella enterica subsp. enterica serovar Newport]